MTLAPTMPVTQQDIDTQKSRVDALNQAIDDGVRQVTIGDQTITYNTTDSLIRARNDARDRLLALQRRFTGARSAPGQVLIQTGSRGYW